MESGRIELYMLAGFLGSGKSTLLARLLEAESKQGRRIGVIMNEVGEISIDSAYIPDGMPLAELLDGCVCCSIQGELTMQLYKMAQTYELDAVYIEATGAAHPLEVLDACTHPSLAPLYDMRAIVGVIDMKQWQNREELKKPVKQLLEAHAKYADIIIGTKQDRLTEVERLAAAKTIKSFQPEAIHSFTSYAQIDTGIITGSLPRYRTDQPHEKTHVHQHLHLRTYTRFLCSALPRMAFENWMRSLPPTVYRAKGFIHVTDTPRLFLFQYAYGEPMLIPYNSDRPCEDVLVFIGDNLDTDRIEQALTELEDAARSAQ
ncbi:G3E family GTPase [Aneurinibacillus soli]|uniref:Putative metal chaperone YciC n=1 Tax=Aneurinibacillus soli TaxID=1500254 RepID=A0A0U5BCI6_9BACL|nr:GTP-binding protein [Aneurinibacillus soli]PYE58179.1 G3E family GTPase [Aneurinibacillus soli]BAU27895.1 putative metal chaperone YciC [Aneurinibacillus soli]